MAVILLLLPLAQFLVPRSASQSNPSSQPTYINEDSKLIYIGNGLIELQFEKSHGGLYSVINKITGEDYRSDKLVPAQLFVLWVDQPNGPIFDSNAASSFSYGVFSNGSEATVTLSLAFTSPYPATVTTTVKVFQNSSFSYWRSSIDNQGDRAVDEIDIPQVTGITSVGNTTEGNYLLVPDGTGSMVTNLYTSFVTNSSAPDYLQTVYPSFGGPLQMMVMGNAFGGVYLATYDTAGNVKGFGGYRDAQGSPPGYSMHLSVFHLFPEQPGQNQSLDYDTVLGVFTGDWYAAADMYRSWAMNQWWAAQGPLYQRSDVPQWFKQGFVTLTMHSHFTYPNNQTVVPFSGIPAKLSEYMADDNSPVLVEWEGWEKFGEWVAPGVFPPYEGWAAFNKTVAAIHAMGQHVIVALSGSALSTTYPGFDTTWLDCAQRLDNGSINYAQGVAWAAPTCPRYQDWLVSTITTLAKAGVDGVRLDANFISPYDYNPNAGHPVGWGSYFPSAWVTIFDRIRAAVDPINPQFLLGGEHLPELFIPWNQIYVDDDGILGYNGEVLAFGSNLHNTGLFDYVYGGYTVGLSRGVAIDGWGSGFQGYKEFSRALEISLGAVVNHAGDWYEWNPPTSAFSQELAWTSSFFAKDFTTFGTRIEPPQFAVPETSVTVPFCCWLSSPTAAAYQTPGVLSSAWLSHDGRLGYIFSNVDNSSHSFGFTVDGSRLAAGESYEVLAVNGMAVTTSAFDPSAPTLIVTLPPKEVLTVEIVPWSSVPQVLLEYDAFDASYMTGSLVYAASAAGLDVSGAQHTLVRAESAFTSQSYQQSIELSLEALNTTAQMFSRFGSSLPNYQAYESNITELQDMFKAGNDTGALNAAENAIGIGMNLLHPRAINVLFDEGHSNEGTNFQAFEEDLDSHGYNLTNNSFPITDALLSKYQVLILCSPTSSYEPSEVKAIENFVRAGGGLFLMAADWTPQAGNNVTEPFGVTIIGDYIHSLHANPNSRMANFAVTNISQTSPITAGVSGLPVNIAAPMEVIPGHGATVLAWTDNDTYSGNTNGPFPFLITEQFGAGRVVIYADNAFQNPWYLVLENQGGAEQITLSRNIMSWISSISWPRTLLVEAVPPSYHVSVGSALTLTFRLLNASSGTSPTATTVVVGSNTLAVGPDGRVNATLTNAEVGTSANEIASASDPIGGLRILYAVQNHNTTVIWDRVNITLSASTLTLPVGSNATIRWTAYYEYDHSPFVGTIVLNDSTVKNSGGTYSYTVSRIVDDKFGLTAFDSNSLSVRFETPLFSTNNDYSISLLAIILISIAVAVTLAYKAKRKKNIGHM